MTLRTIVLLPLCLAAACAGREDAATSDTSAAAASAAPASTADLERQVADVASYRLTMDGFDKYLQAQKNLVEKARTMPEAPGGTTSSEEPKDVDGMVRQIEATPMMRDAVRDAGLSPREYATITFAYMSAAMAAGIQKMRPNDDADSLARAMKASPENARFVREHEAELNRKMESLKTAAGGGR